MLAAALLALCPLEVGAQQQLGVASPVLTHTPALDETLELRLELELPAEPEPWTPASLPAVSASAEHGQRQATPGEPAPPPARPRAPVLDPTRCLSPEELERAERNRSRTAFQDSAIPLGPIFWASRDRTFMQIMMIYWRFLGIEERTRLELLFPLYLSYCAPEADTQVGPLGVFGWRTDEAGTAGYWGPYFYRRDQDEKSDVLFPLFWWLRDADSSTFILLNTFSLKQRGEHDFGFLPLYLGYRGARQAYYDITPVFARWGERDLNAWWTLQTWYRQDRRGWELRSLPFYLGGERGGAYHHLVPPLLSFFWGDDDESYKIVTLFYDFEKPSGSDSGLLPFAGWGHSDGGPTVSSVLIDEARHLVGGPEGLGLGMLPARGAAFEYLGSPLLLFLHWDDGQIARTHLAQSWLWRSQVGYDFGSVPFYFRGRDAQGGWYDVAPLLLNAHWGDAESEQHIVGPWYDLRSEGERDFGLLPLFAAGSDADGEYLLTPLGGHWGQPDGEHLLWVLQTLAWWDATGWDVWSVPFYFGGANDAGDAYWLVPPLLSLHFSHRQPGERAAPAADDYDLTLIGPYYGFSALSGSHHGLLPLFAFGAFAAERSTPLNYWAIPPLLGFHVDDEHSGFTLVLQTYLRNTEAGYDFGSVPFYFRGRDTTGSFYDVAPLLFARWGDDSISRTQILQTYFQHGAGGWQLWSVPFFFGGQSDDEDDPFYYQVVPLLLLARWGTRGESNLIAGPVYWVEDDRGRDLGVLPVYLSGTSYRSGGAASPSPLASVLRDEVLAPVFGPAFARGLITDRFHYFLIPPFLTLHFGQSLDEDFTWVAQTYLSRSTAGWDFGSIPFYFGGAANDRADGKPGAHYHVAPPLLFAHWGEGDDDYTIAGPWYDLRTRDDSGQLLRDWGLVPLVFGGADASWHYLFGPGFGQWGDGDEEKLWVLQTLHERTPQGWSVASVPFYFGGEALDDDGEVGAFHHVVPPLLAARWGDETRGEHNLVVGPVFNLSSPGAQDFGLAPLYLAGENSGGVDRPLLSLLRTGALQDFFGPAHNPAHYRLVPPLLYAHAGDGSFEHTWFLQSYLLRDQEGYDLGSIPIYFHGRRGQAGYYDVAPLLLFGRWGDALERNLWIGQTWHHSEPDRSWLWSAPFYFGGEGSDGGYYHLVPVGLSLFYGNHTERSHRAFVAPPLFMRWEDPDETTTLALLWYQSDDRSGGAWSRALVPFWFAGEDGYARWSMLLPLYLSWADAAQETFFLLGWFSRRYSNGDFSRGFLPAYYESQERSSFFRMYSPALFQWGDRNETHTLIPPLLAYADKIRDQTFLIAPLVWHSADRERSDTVVFPFYWSFRGPRLDATVVSGLWWDFDWHTEGKRLRIAPGYLNWDDPEESFYIAGPVSWSRGRGAQEQAWSFHLVPALSVWSYHPEHIKWRALIAAFGYERERDTEQLMFFGVKTEPRQVTETSPGR